MRSVFAAKADEVVYGDREETYDDPNRNFRRIAQAWSAVTPYEFTPRMVAIMMATMKLVREGHKHTDDNVIDAHGYLMCLERIINEELDNDSSALLPQMGKHPDADTFVIPEKQRPIITRRPPRDALDSDL